MKWCLEHGSFSGKAATATVRYLDDKGVPLRLELNVIGGKLFVTYKNDGYEPMTREVRDGETFYVEVRARKDGE